MFEYLVNDIKYFVWSGRKIIVEDIVEFDWPGVTLSFLVVGVSELHILMNGAGNCFNIHCYLVQGDSYLDTSKEIFSYRLDTDYRLRTYNLLDIPNNTSKIGLSLGKKYLFQIVKRTEPRMKGIMQEFGVVSMKSVQVQGDILPLHYKDVYPYGWTEVIGDSDVCGFGVESLLCSSPLNIISWDYKHENIERTFPNLVATKFKLAVHTIAWSGKGVARNAPFSGSETMADLYPRLLSCRKEHLISADSDTTNILRYVLIYLGANDMNSLLGPPKATHFHTKFMQLILTVRNYRGNHVPILCLVTSPSCASSEGSPTLHPQDSSSAIQHLSTLHHMIGSCIQEYKLRYNDDHIFMIEIDDKLDVPEDYGTMMHWNAQGHAKMATYFQPKLEECVYLKGI